ncbi:hypothetical protein QMO56_02130 [Roseomonas sp. E05]|uniref:hypothetical protein n=1 Tax=Roseomonas sp. E05 TaxID=3046310 RepID=UPI0024B98386|nr:hypothetical protein [Roseomonas sp. E05]MDJ0386899.1 hypothetical protein [Roseomonas sp. E05]
MISVSSSNEASSSSSSPSSGAPETFLASDDAVQSAVWSVQSYAFTYGDGTFSHISVIGGRSGQDPLAGLDGVRVPGATPGDDVIYAGPDDNTIEGGVGADALHGGPGPDLFIYRMGDGNDTIRGFDPQTDRLVILGAPSVSLDSDPGGAMVQLPDGATITLHVSDLGLDQADLLPAMLLAQHACLFL